MQTFLAQPGYETLWLNRGGCSESILNTALLHPVFFMPQQVGRISVEGLGRCPYQFVHSFGGLAQTVCKHENTDNLIGITGPLNETNSGQRKRGIPGGRQQIYLKGKEKNQAQFKVREIKGTSSRNGALSSVSKASAVV